MQRRTAARATGAALLAGAVLAGCGPQRPREVTGDLSLSGAQQIACARTIVEGDVVDAHQAEGKHRIAVTLSVADWIKPARGGSTTSLDIVDPAVEHGRGYAVGDHVLMIVLKPRQAGATTLRGDDLKRYRARLPSDLRRAKKATCPAWASDL